MQFLLRYITDYKCFICVFVLYANIVQGQIVGKTYEAVLSSHCKKMSGGGCVVDECCSISFKNGIAQARYYRRSDCVNEGVSKKTEVEHVDKRQQCTYSVRQNVLLIKGFQDYKKFEIGEKQLLGFPQSGHEAVLFKEVVRQNTDSD